MACQSNPSTKVLITSGGGFSNYYATPSYQQPAVANYLAHITTGTASNPTPSAGFNRSGRAYPDISLLAHKYFVVLNATAVGLDGTSASSPVMAAMVNLINAQRRQAGLSTLGFLNPALYAKGSYFVNDITSGSNLCTALYYSSSTKTYLPTCCKQGFYCEGGWDPVTGLGSVDFAAMNAALGVTLVTDESDDDNTMPAGSIAGIVIGTMVVMV